MSAGAMAEKKMTIRDLIDMCGTAIDASKQALSEVRALSRQPGPPGPPGRDGRDGRSATKVSISGKTPDDGDQPIFVRQLEIEGKTVRILTLDDD